MLLGLTGAGNLLTLVGTGNTGVRGTEGSLRSWLLCSGRLDKPKASNKLFVPWCHFPFPLVIQTINLESCRYEPLLRLGRQEPQSHLIISSSWHHSVRGEKTRFCLFHGPDTLTLEQANDILIGHQKSPDKGLGEVIICYKIISTLSSLCEHWVETTTERGGG